MEKSDGRMQSVTMSGLGNIESIKSMGGEKDFYNKWEAAYSQALYRELDQMILREDLIDVFYERAFERPIPQGHTFRVVDTTHYYSYEIDTPEDYEHVRNQTILP